MRVLPALLERFAVAVENASFLDAPGDAGQRLTGLLGPGRIKDALSGTDAGHPVHPALVAVPMGAFAGAALLDATGGDAAASRRLIGFGLLASLPTAATGMSDWGDTAGGERRVGVAHAAANSVALILFAASWLARGGDRSGRGGAALSYAGLGVLGASGWLGGHLAYAQGVGVDTTAFQQLPTDWVDACAEAEVQEGALHGASVEGTDVVLSRVDGVIHALADRCTHRGAPLHEGAIVDGCVECPWHGSRFRLDGGGVERGPATRPQPAFETRVEDGRVLVRRAEPRSLRTNPAG